MLRGDAAPGVPHRDTDQLATAPGAHSNNAILSKLDRIVKQVEKNASQLVAVAGGHEGGRDLTLDEQTAFASQWRERLDDIFQQQREIDRVVRHQARLVAACDQEQILNQGAEARGRRADIVERALILLRCASPGAYHAKNSLDCGKRCAELVRGIRRELPLTLK